LKFIATLLCGHQPRDRITLLGTAIVLGIELAVCPADDPAGPLGGCRVRETDCGHTLFSGYGLNRCDRFVMPSASWTAYCSRVVRLGSVVSQRDHRIDSSGTPRWDIARSERDERQQAHNSGHGDWIMCADAE
jgi:hypothetical protein